MNRRDFLKQCALWAAAVPVVPWLGGCTDPYGVGLYDNFEVNFSGSVLIIGAGASGLAAGYLLERYGIDYQVLEASERFGGRVKQLDSDFADFPIDLGAEWIHDHPSILAALRDDATAEGSVEVIPYSPQSISVWKDDCLSSSNWARHYYQEYKFKRTTWYGFLERYIAPSVLPNILFEQPVVQIDTTGNQVEVTTEDGTVYRADRVLLTVPIAVLQSGSISFVPELSQERIDALDRIEVPHGIKVFHTFTRRFYPDLILDGGLLDENARDKLYYDAAFGKGASSHVMGLFWVSNEASRLTELESDEAIVDAVIAELDLMFDGKASRYLTDSIVQNWSADPYIRGAYSVDFVGGQSAVTSVLQDPIDGRVFLSGEAFGGDNSSTVHGAMESAYAMVELILLDA